MTSYLPMATQICIGCYSNGKLPVTAVPPFLSEPKCINCISTCCIQSIVMVYSHWPKPAGPIRIRSHITFSLVQIRTLTPDWNIHVRSVPKMGMYPFGKGIQIWIQVSGNTFCTICSHRKSKRIWILNVEISHNVFIDPTLQLDTQVFENIFFHQLFPDVMECNTLGKGWWKEERSVKILHRYYAELFHISMNTFAWYPVADFWAGQWAMALLGSPKIGHNQFHVSCPHSPPRPSFRICYWYHRIHWLRSHIRFRSVWSHCYHH